MRTTFVYGNEFWNFYHAQKLEVQDKIGWVIGLVRTLRMVPEKFFKHLEGTDGLYEIRVKLGSDIYRIFCFFEKKSAKTPVNEIKKAESLKQKYYEDKSRK